MTTTRELNTFAAKYRLRNDWHEPDEQGVTAEVVGGKLDNAGGLPLEKTVILKVHNEEKLRVNLATLLALACRSNLETPDL